MPNCFSTVPVMVLVLASAGSAAGASLEATSVVRADMRTGRLVRRTYAPSLAKLKPREVRELVRIDQLVKEAAGKYGVDPLLVQSVIEIESNYNPFAVSSKG